MIKNHLSRLLGERRWTQARLARETGIRPSTISAYYNELAERISYEHISLSPNHYFVISNDSFPLSGLLYGKCKYFRLTNVKKSVK